MSFTFISSGPTGAATRTVSAKDRLRIRSQVMRSSWAEKKRHSEVIPGEKNQSGRRKVKTVRWDADVEDNEGRRMDQEPGLEVKFWRRSIGKAPRSEAEGEKVRSSLFTEEATLL